MIGDAALLLANRVRARGAEHPGRVRLSVRLRPRRVLEGVDRTAVRVRGVGRAANRARCANALQVHARLLESRDWGLSHLDVLAEQASAVTGVARRNLRSSICPVSTIGCRTTILPGSPNSSDDSPSAGIVPADSALVSSRGLTMRDLLDFYTNAPLLELGPRRIACASD